MAPPNSYIHVEDFDTPHELAKYLDYLDKNETAYAEYHQWRAMEPDFSSPIRSGAGKSLFPTTLKDTMVISKLSEIGVFAKVTVYMINLDPYLALIE